MFLGEAGGGGGLTHAASANATTVGRRNRMLMDPVSRGSIGSSSPGQVSWVPE